MICFMPLMNMENKNKTKEEQSLEKSSNQDKGVADRKNGEVMAASYSGPLPPPAMFEQYNNVVPGAAERILQMAEKQSEHRHDIENRIVRTETRKSVIGLFLAFFIVVLGIGAGAFIVFNGKEISGLVAMFGPLAIIASIFVYREKQSKED